MHYVAVVIGVEAQQLPVVMEPFNQCTENPAFLQFDDVEDTYLNRYETEFTDKIRLNDGTLKWPWDESFKEGSLFDGKRTYPPDSERVQIAYRELYPDFETFMEDYADVSRDEETGRYGNWTNLKGVWDWYVVGGRWSGFFKNKPGTPHRFVPNRYEAPPPTGFSDLVRVGDWDFAGQMDQAAERAARHYVRVYEVLDGRPLPPPWQDVLQAHNGNMAAAREASQAHPTNIFINSLWSDPKMREEGLFDPFTAIADEYGCSLEQYIERARLRTATPYAILKDGEWVSRRLKGGKLGEEIPELEWCRKIHGVYSELSPDTELIAVDYHC